MATIVRSRKGLVTKRLNSAVEWIARTEDLLSPPPEGEKKSRASEVRLALKVCEEHTALLESSLNNLAEAFEKMEEHSKEDEVQFDQYMNNAHDVIMKLQAHKENLLHLLHQCTDATEAIGVRFPGGSREAGPLNLLSISQLPTIPIPNFSGKRWEWSNFWTLFRANVHDQDLSDLQKFNYLLTSLSGQAKQSISRYQVTAENYSKALEHLQARYGQREDIVLDLHRSLSASTARGPSTEDQRQLFEKLSAIAAQLQDLGEHMDTYLAVHTFVQKFHSRIQKSVMKKLLQQDVTADWSFNLWLHTIDSIISQEEKMKELLSENSDRSKPPRPQSSVPLSSGCEFCNQRGHRWNSCPRIPTAAAKREFLLETNRCLNCGSNKHRVASCPSGNCRICHEKHNTAICTRKLGRNQRNDTNRSAPPTATERQPRSSPAEAFKQKPTKSVRQHVITKEAESSAAQAKQETIVLQTHRQAGKPSKVILLVGTVKVLDSKDQVHEAVVLLDTGSEVSFISEDLARKLDLPVVDRTPLCISTFGATSPSTKMYDVAKLRFYDIEGCKHELCLHQTEHITGTIEQTELDEEDAIFISKHGIVLSMEYKSEAVQPQLLLGCDYLWDFMMPVGKLILPSGLQLIPTKFGYIASGRHAQQDQGNPTARTLTILKSSEKETWDRYWTLESSGTEEFTGSRRTESQLANEKVLHEFNSTIQRRHDGYYVRLPWKLNHEKLPDNKAIALKRLQKVLEMYTHKKDVLQQYDEIFKEQLQKGILEEVPEDEPSKGTVVHYLPHQAVITPAKETTKMRIVFDASAHYKDKPCLNEVLHQGPLLLPDMVAILLRFRLHKIAIISDVEKAFLQVRLQEIDRDATRCMWVRDPHVPPTPDNIVEYRFTRVTFGLNASPFLLAATIKYHLDNMTSTSNIATEIKENLYVDNLIMGAQSSEEALDKYQLSKAIFNGINMNLREFMSNDDVFNDNIRHEDRTKAQCPKVLGVPWNPKNDTILLRGTMSTSVRITKRTVSMQLASIYDPFGFLVPVLLPAKIFLQALWKEEYSWDQPLASKLQDQWRSIISEITTFYKEVGREVADIEEDATMYVFTDASQFAMATCVYIGTPNKANFVMAKSKLPSLKTAITIPKLEMNAFTLGARVAHFVYTATRALLRIRRILFFTDSEIVLGWLKTPPERSRVGVLVSNRLKEVRRIVADLETNGAQCQFGHIPTIANPADCGTRGFSSSSCPENYWWNGPPLVQGDVTEMPEYNQMFTMASQESTDDEDRAPATAISLLTTRHTNVDELTLFPLNRFNSLQKAQRVAAYVLRFIKKALCHFPPWRKDAIIEAIPALRVSASTHEFSGPELSEARKCIIRDHQQNIVSKLGAKPQMELNVKHDGEGVLRCYGRLKHAAIPTSATTPIFIAAKTALANLIIWEAHSQYHVGVAHTMSKIREHYWIPKLRQQVTKILRRCIPCQKFNNLPFRYPQMEDAPKRRVTRTRPFEHVGLDYFGPLTFCNEGGELSKSYGCILTCAATRLIHLELIEDMSAGKFLNALRRFFARRGVPRTITCDNAPTFLLGERILHEAVKQMIEHSETSHAIAQKEIAWIHITPYAPWQGGFYERLIRSVKLSLYKALGKRTVSFDVLQTLLTEIEAVLNSRPLTYQEERWEEHSILRPIDFLQRDILLDFPLQHLDSTNNDPTYHTVEEAQHLATQRKVEAALQSSVQLTEDFWRIWSRHYLTSLREHHKRYIDSTRGTTRTPKEGTVVLLWESEQPRNKWSLGRIAEVHRNELNTVREVVVELPNKHKIRRPINRVVPLEVGAVDDDVNSELRPTTTTDDLQKPHEPDSVVPRYNLRKRKQTNYKEDDSEDSQRPSTSSNVNVLRTLPLTFALLLLIIPSTVRGHNTTGAHHLQCVENGVRLLQTDSNPYDVCTTDYCVSVHSPRQSEVIKFPPQSTLHDYPVKWKITKGETVEIVETICKATPFCANINCILCTANIANPECWPKAAIAGMGLALYLIFLMCYALFAVPLIVGRPLISLLRLLALCGQSLLRAAVNLSTIIIPRGVIRLLAQFRHRPRRRIWSELAVLLTVTMTLSRGCQEVDLLHQQIEACHFSTTKTICSIDTTSIVKINPFKREACLRMTANDSTVTEIRIVWKDLQLICEKETILYTRSTSYGLIDSKRCPHAGSCTGEKCSAINRTSMVPELHKAQHYPGVTGCVESCGGPGCGCFYSSSGCLYYRIYLIPDNDDVFEFYRCTRWTESIQLLVILGDAEVAKSRKQFSVRLLPNQPKKLSWLTLTLSSLAVPPTPILSSTFLTNGKQTALAPRHYSPPLVCKTWSDARNLSCEVDEDCTCTPAEEKMHCDCKNINLTSYVREPDRSIPQIRPNVELNVARQQLIAKIPQLPTAEFVLRIHGRFGTTALISDAICTVENVHCVGCYKCTKGAQAVVNCKSSTPQETAEVRCGDNSFAIPCTYEGTHSKLRFYPDTARFYVNCTVRCGHTAHQFEITGILHYTGSLHGAVRRLVNGESEVYSEINFPDFGHMADVFLHWTGSLVLVIVLAAIAILTTYLCLSSTLLLSLTRFLFRLILTMLCNIVRLAKLIACKLLWKHVHHEYQHRHKPDHKLL